jgi:hypothetical protein
MTWLSPEGRHVTDDGRQSMQLNTKEGAASTPVDGDLPLSASGSATHVHDGDVVGIRTLSREADRAGQRLASKVRATSPVFGIRRVVA